MAAGRQTSHKQWRGLDTRHGKHATNYRATHVLPAVITWLDAIEGTP
jgi:hypothetical protein